MLYDDFFEELNMCGYVKGTRREIDPRVGYARYIDIDIDKLSLIPNLSKNDEISIVFYECDTEHFNFIISMCERDFNEFERRKLKSARDYVVRLRKGFDLIEIKNRIYVGTSYRLPDGLYAIIILFYQCCKDIVETKQFVKPYLDIFINNLD